MSDGVRLHGVDARMSTIGRRVELDVALPTPPTPAKESKAKARPQDKIVRDKEPSGKAKREQRRSDYLQEVVQEQPHRAQLEDSLRKAQRALFPRGLR